LASNCLGLLSYFLADKQQRTAFLETRQCLEMKMVIEEQSTEQEKKKIVNFSIRHLSGRLYGRSA